MYRKAGAVMPEDITWISCNDVHVFLLWISTWSSAVGHTSTAMLWMLSRLRRQITYSEQFYFYKPVLLYS